jgi:tetrapyrrole methylase family protein/MazG family protein
MDNNTTNTAAEAADAFLRFAGIVMQLRDPGGCPWDLEQSPRSLRGDLIEETYECIEAIDEKDPAHIGEELGDLFLLVTMIAYMHQQEGVFSIADVLERVSEKIIRRHPHVFGDVKVKDSAEVLDNWARIKVEQEGRKPKDSLLDEVSRGLPPLDRAWKLQKKAAKAGFDWPDIRGVFEKVREELDEAEEAIQTGGGERIEEELGDLLFAAVNLCRFTKVEASVALQKTNAKFIRRFQYVEKRMKETGAAMIPENLARMDGFWEEAKGREPPVP